MIIDLGKFLVIWSVILIMFTCVALLAFGELHDFYTFEQTLIFFLESALGNWDMDVYAGTNDHGEPLELVGKLGTYYQIIFLLVNLVLMLNFVIAILSSTYGRFEDIQTGLYYNVLIQEFPVMSYDDEFGCLVCA